MSQELKLFDRGRVAIIGAGPAGSLFAYTLLRLAQREHLTLQVDIYDPRDFSKTGPSGCNQCAGVISGSLYQRLERIGIRLEDEEGLIRSVLKGYLCSSQNHGFSVEVPEGFQPIRTVYRGGGPRSLETSGNVSYDHYLLNRALAEGARYTQAKVMVVEPTPEKPGPVKVTLREHNCQQIIEADLVVGAFGINSTLTKLFAEKVIKEYRSPRCRRTAQLELKRQKQLNHHTLDQYIRVWDLPGPRVKQLILTPKGDHATLTLLGPCDLTMEDVEQIKNSTEMKGLLVGGWDVPEKTCYCLPLITLRSAQNFYSDQILLIGDAACCRYYKNGLESALLSAQFAAETVMYHGISRSDFHRFYFPRVQREIIHDNFYGRILLSTHQKLLLHPKLFNLITQARSAMKRRRMMRHHDDILWDMLTGNRPYRHIFYRVIQSGFLLTIIICIARLLTIRFQKGFFQRIKSLVRWPFRRQTSTPSIRISGNAPKPNVLWSGCRVSIIGGGPAGTSCAIMLMKLARQKNIDLEVTIHEPKHFTQAASVVYDPMRTDFYDQRVNQCAGVLSQPIYEILTQNLGIGFPDHLVQKYITGYALHAEQETIELDELYGASFAVRRIMFDDYMMQQAVKYGAQWNLGEVLSIEKQEKVFRLTTSGVTMDADVLVGSFGVNQQMADLFEDCFDYRRPEYMQTIVNKRHPSSDFLREFGLRIHAFLPALRSLEFGAITPKFNHLTVNIAGRQVTEKTMHDFLALPQVARWLPETYDELGHETYYPGCFPTSPAGNIFADHMVVVGDASGMLRPFKGKGINAAILSGSTAARVMAHRGLTRNDFKRFYYPMFHQIIDDLWYARIARTLTHILANHQGMDIVLNLAKDSPELKRALTEAVSGACTYKTILSRLTNENILWRSGTSMTRLLFRSVRFINDT